MQIRSSFILFFSLLLVACEPVESGHKKEAPDDLIPKDVMTNMLVDVHIIEGARSGVRVLGDSVPADLYYDGLFKKYGVTQTQYDSSFRYYSHYPTVMTEMYDVVIDSLNIRKIKIDEALRQYQSKNDDTEEIVDFEETSEETNEDEE